MSTDIAHGQVWRSADGVDKCVFHIMWFGADGYVWWTAKESMQQACEPAEPFTEAHDHVGTFEGASSLLPAVVSEWCDVHGFDVYRTDEKRPVCPECGERVEFSEHYMLVDDLWLSIAGQGECLHFWCAEGRLGREIVEADLRDVPVNRLHRILMSRGGQP